MKPIRSITVNSLSEFLGHIENEKKAEEEKGNNADFIFRGQRTDEPLLPRLARIAPEGQLLKIEQLMFEEFKRTSPALTELNPESLWDFLALAQHHRLPTRLLDWTHSALAGLWFAVERTPKREKGKRRDAVVWLLKTNVDDFVDKPSRESPFANGLTRIYRPRVITRRIAAQGGLFTVHKIMKGENFVALEKNKRFWRRLVKFVIPALAFPNIRKHLNGCGVNRFSLFPDLDGLCTHLAWRYTKMDD